MDRKKRFLPSTKSTLRDEMKKERERREKEYQENFKPRNLWEAVDLVGTCMDFCPEFEVLDRQANNEIDSLEIVGDDKIIAIKKYRRSAAGSNPEIFPEDIRPPHILLVRLKIY